MPVGDVVGSPRSPEGGLAGFGVAALVPHTAHVCSCGKMVVIRAPLQIEVDQVVLRDRIDMFVVTTAPDGVEVYASETRDAGGCLPGAVAGHVRHNRCRIGRIGRPGRHLCWIRSRARPPVPACGHARVEGRAMGDKGRGGCPTSGPAETKEAATTWMAVGPWRSGFTSMSHSSTVALSSWRFSLLWGQGHGGELHDPVSAVEAGSRDVDHYETGDGGHEGVLGVLR